MTPIVSDEKLTATKVTIKGDENNETFYVYGTVNVAALKAFLQDGPIDPPPAARTRRPRRSKAEITAQEAIDSAGQNGGEEPPTRSRRVREPAFGAQ